MDEQQAPMRPPGCCVPWDERRAECGELQGDEEVAQRVWEDVDQLGWLYIWSCLIAF